MIKWLPLLPLAIFAASCSGDCPAGEHPHRITGSCVADDPDRLAPSIGINGADSGVTIIIGGHSGRDAGTNTDAGTVSPIPYAEVWAIERHSGVGGGVRQFDIGAVLVDDVAARVTRTSMTIADLEGGQCVLSTRRVIGGQPRPYLVSGLHLQFGADRVDLSMLLDGTYLPSVPPMGSLAAASVAELVVDDDGSPGTLDAFTVQLSVPPQLTLFTPIAVAQVDLSVSNSITWALLPLATNPVVIELATADREVLLRCGTNNDGFYAFSPDSLAAFRNEAGAMPFVLDISSESRAVGLTSVDGFDPVPVVFRIAYAVRFDAR